MVENGFFCLWPDEASTQFLKQIAPSCHDSHITILAIDDEKEINRLYSCPDGKLLQPIKITLKM